MPKNRIPPIDRFNKKYTVNHATGCWEWNAGRNRQGYGTFMYAPKKHTSAHRWSYSHFKGPIPEGLQVLHSCDNPPCCNPAHLRVGDQSENMRECVAKRRFHWANKTHCPKGHPYNGINLSLEIQRGGYPNRICKECRRIRGRAYNARKKLERIAG